jgi:2-C-methyl-D-erythritol 2,4-cyclodiphosphate synthase
VRVGIGYDIHRFAPNRKLVLGGVEIPYYKGLEGYSDADVVLHAICDALLGAMGKGDMGEHFPNNNTRYRGISSANLLGEVGRMLAEGNYRVCNVDVTIIAQEPKLVPFKKKMESSVAEILGIESSQVNVKATTAEYLGSLGRGEAIAVHAVAAIESK